MLSLALVQHFLCNPRENAAYYHYWHYLLGQFFELNEKLTTDLCCCKESVGCVAWFATLAVGSICVLIKKAQYLSPTARKHGFYGHVGTLEVVVRERVRKLCHD